jgi:hypothetical protein
MEATMPWTEITRPHHERRCPRYASDLMDAEWTLIEAMMPTTNRIGRLRKTDGGPRGRGPGGEPDGRCH